MFYEIHCKKDCANKIGGKCKYQLEIKNSIFPGEIKPCIYYSAKINKATPLPSPDASILF